MVSQFYSPVIGGQERAVENLSTALARRGHHVAIVTLSQDGATASTEQDGLTVHRVRGSFQRLRRLFSDPSRPHLPPAPDPGAMRAFRQIVDLESPDVVHAHDWFAWSAAPVVRQQSLPFLLSLHDYSLVCANKRLIQGEHVCSGPGLAKCVRCAAGSYGRAKGTSIALALRWLSPAVTSAVDRFLPVSGAVAASARLAARGLPFEVVPNFVPDSLFGQSRSSIGEDEAVPQPHTFPPRYAIFVGDVTRDKGAAVLLAAHRTLGGNLPLVLVGRMLLDEASPPPESVAVWGPQPHALVIEAIQRSQFAVVPSICPETFGLVALEAMALGRPVVAARIGGLQDLVLDGRTGILVPPGDAPALAEAMARLRDHDDLRTYLGQRARSHARTFSESEVVPRVERIYQEVVAAHPQPPQPGRPRVCRIAAQ
jgi:glycosyltransferase involved in cell wall biosynthesis